MRSVRPSYAHGDRAGLDSVRARQKEREFFPIPFFLDFVRGGDFGKCIFQNCACAFVRASVRPEAQSSRICRFRLTEIVEHWSQSKSVNNICQLRIDWEWRANLIYMDTQFRGPNLSNYQNAWIAMFSEFWFSIIEVSRSQSTTYVNFGSIEREEPI